MTSDVSPAERYRARRARFAQEAAGLAERSGRIANLRLVVFLGALVGAGWWYWGQSALAGLVALLLLVGFGGLVVGHIRLERRRRRATTLAQINDEGCQRLARDWSALPLRHSLGAAADHPYARDLDLLGRASLLHLLDVVGTQAGETTLGRWLLGPSEPATIRARQAAVAELAPLVELREELTWRCRGSAEARLDPEPFLDWAEGEPTLQGRGGLIWLARITPVVLLGLFGASLAGLIAYPLWLIPLVVNLWLGQLLVGTARRSIEQVSSLAPAFRTYAEALELIANAPFEAAELRRVQAILKGDGPSAAGQLRRLGRLISFAQPPSSMLYPTIELATLWNVHVLDALERWQTSAGRQARGWLAALGELEALAALATLAHDNPEWSMAEIDPGATVLTADGLGHPLLPSEVRVVNNVELGPPGSFLLVTGSNMSGKSTLLRAVGLNVVLAQAGGPVCATRLRMPPVELWTSMRVQDSLERGVSYFMAELERLKQIVDASCAVAERDGARQLQLYLLDEILQGTNTAERQVAARRIIRLLLSRPAIGAVSTHDLTLADVEDLRQTARAVHLTETVSDGPDGPGMSFDYKLRPGIARSSNALRLMELVGLPAE